MKETFVREIRERDWVDSLFLVRDKIMAMAKNGKPYMTLKLMDKTGEVEGRVWDRVDEFAARFDKDDFIRVQGRASVYLGKMQLVVQDLQKVADGDVDPADFLPVAGRTPEQMLAELETKVASLQDGHLKSLMQAFLADEEFLTAYATAPAAKTMHHVYLGGLLEHSLAVADLAEEVSRRYPGINRDLLVTGALLHDIGKVAELSYRRAFDYTDAGKLLGHIVMGVEMIEAKIRRIDGFPELLATLLKHMLLSHHGQYEFGSPKRPKTLEAVILNFLDDLDSKINGVRAHIEREGNGEGNGEGGWTGYHRLYDRYFFHGPSALDDVGLASPDEEPSRPGPQPPVADRQEQQREKRRHERNRPLGFSLAEQLKGKSLDLFTAEENDDDA